MIFRGNPSCKGRFVSTRRILKISASAAARSSRVAGPPIATERRSAAQKLMLRRLIWVRSTWACAMAQQKIFKSRLLAKDFIKFSEKSNNNNHVSGSPRWQYYSGTGSQRIVVSDRKSIDNFPCMDRKHVTRVSVNNYQCYQSRSLSDLRILLPDVTSSTRVSRKVRTP